MVAARAENERNPTVVIRERTGELVVPFGGRRTKNDDGLRLRMAMGVQYL